MMGRGHTAHGSGRDWRFLRRRAKATAFTAVSSLALFATPLAAQQVAPPTRDDLLPPGATQDTAPPVRLTIDGALERTPCALDNPDYAALKVTLGQVRVVGAEKAPEIDPARAYAGYLGRELPLSVLCDIRAALAQQLQAAGYLATVEIPAQKLTGGEAELRIVYGRLTALRVRGDAGPSEQLVASYLEPLTREEVFNAQRAERFLLLADDLPGVDVRLSLRPAANGAPGDLIGEVAVVRRRAALDFNIQNYGSKALGRFGAMLRGEIYDLTGLGDRTALALYSTLDFEEQQTIQLAHDFALGGSGLRLGGQFTYSWANPTLGIDGFDVESETPFGTLELTYPLERSRTATSWARLGIDYADQDVFVNDFRIARDRVRTAFLRFDGSWADAASIAGVGGYSQFEPRFAAHGGFEVRRGLDILDASPDCRPNPLACVAAGLTPSHIEADPTPTLVRSDFRVDFRPVPLVRFSLGADAQYTKDPLPAFEEFSAGNFTVGRGYDPGAITGDRGIALSAELAYGSLVPKARDAWAIQPYVFTDVAWTWNEDPSRRAFNPDRLWSAGGGLRVLFGGAVQGDLTLAVPLDRPDLAASRGDVRVLFSLTTRLYPWSF